MQTLREGIRARYHTYQQRDPDRYPHFEFNTNRANYEPLRDSFEEEFFRVRGYDPKTLTIAIPSTSTLAQVFTDDAYVPSRKILNTCQSYAEGPAQADSVVKATYQTGSSVPDAKPAFNWWLAAVVGTIALISVCFIGWRVVHPKPSGLVINRPVHKTVVRHETIIEGRATNAKAVWIVERSVFNDLYWVYKPIHVYDDGYWLSTVYVGSRDASDSGYAYQIRAFVNPKEELQLGPVPAWPEAELASNIVEVVRGPIPN